jgi:hypothetical protein
MLPPNFCLSLGSMAEQVAQAGATRTLSPKSSEAAGRRGPKILGKQDLNFFPHVFQALLGVIAEQIPKAGAAQTLVRYN